MTLWVFGQRGLVVEHDPATREPLEGGKVIRAVAVKFNMNGDTEVVADEFIPGAEPRFASNGWIATWEGSPAENRWRLMTPEEAREAGAWDG